jgi:hypothetical protein
LTTDNLYTSIPLANKLLERSTTLVGTMRHNRVGLPKEVKSLENRDENSTEVWWERTSKRSLITPMLSKPKARAKKTSSSFQ